MEPDAPLDEFYPEGWSNRPEGQRVPADGWHLIVARATGATLQKVGFEKPYALIDAVVVSADYEGLKFNFRVYLHPASEGWARYFLAKWEYPQELLEQRPPLVKCSNIVGLEGMLLLLVSNEGGMLNIDVKGFGHAAGDPDLEKRFFKMRGQQQAAEESVDVYDDLRQVSSSGQVEDDDPWPTE